MATGPKVVEIIDHALNLPGAGARYWRDRLVGARIIQGRQGPSPDTPLHDVALTLIAVLIGPAAVSRPEIVREYAALQSEGEAFSVALTKYLADPHDLLELVVDNFTQAAAIRHRDETGNVVVTTFMSPEIEERPAFSRLSCVPANAFTSLAEAIRNAPTSTPKRRRRRRRNAT